MNIFRNRHNLRKRILIFYCSIVFLFQCIVSVSCYSNQQTIDLPMFLNLIEGETISILGDSISTYEGYSNDTKNTNSTIGNNAVFYSDNNGNLQVEDTWWMQVIRKTNARLLVNNSWSGSTVSGNSASSGNSTRACNLHDDTGSNSGESPDIIFVYMGINDYNYGVPVADFAYAYVMMVDKIIKEYPYADLFCMTLPYCGTTNQGGIEDYNSSIKGVCKKIDATVIDINALTWGKYDYEKYFLEDGIHPNYLGMDEISLVVLNTLQQYYIK